MKVWIQHKLGGSGKGKFLERLVHEFDKRGVSWSRKRRGCDVALGAIRWQKDVSDIPSVLRIDGAHLYDDKRRHWINKQIRKGCKKATAVIWQSAFCKTMGNKFLKCRPRKEFVIHNGGVPMSGHEQNGAARQFYKALSGCKIVAMCARFKNRPQKGLKEMVRLAMHYVAVHPEVHFFICGKVEDKYTTQTKYVHPNMHFAGHVGDAYLRPLFSAADTLLYLASYDWCPNSVVEAQVLGLPVIYIKGHALDELVGEHGIGIASSRPLVLKYTRHSRRPSFDYSEAAAALDTILENPYRVERPDLHIDHIATKYLEALQWACEHK